MEGGGGVGVALLMPHKGYKMIMSSGKIKKLLQFTSPYIIILVLLF